MCGAAATTFLTDGLCLQQAGNKAFSAGDFAQAVQCYTRCLELDASMTAARSNRALAHLKGGDPTSALEDCEAVLAEDASNVKVWLRRGQAYSELGQKEEAIQSWEKALHLQPTNVQAQKLLQASRAPP